jgi:hypothetical protein
MMKRYILVDRKPVECDDLVDWEAWREMHRADCLVEHEVVLDRFVVSTLFIGIEDRIFETAVFLDKNVLRTRWCETWEDAEAQHKRVVASVRRRFVN